MKEFSGNQRYSLKEAENEAVRLECILESGNAKDYDEARSQLPDLRLVEKVNMGSTSLESLHDITARWQAKDGYKWLYKDGKYVPADEDWSPLDLSPHKLEEIPWPGDFCYLNMHPDCQHQDCKDTQRQLAFVYNVDQEEGYANIMLVSDDLTIASDVDAILGPKETRIPFKVVVERMCGPVFFDQLSKPVGYCDQLIINAMIEATYTGKPDLPDEKLGEPINSTEDPRWEYQGQRAETLKKLYCYCLNKMLFKDDLATEVPDDHELEDDFEDEEELGDEGYETDNKNYSSY